MNELELSPASRPTFARAAGLLLVLAGASPLTWAQGPPPPPPPLQQPPVPPQNPITEPKRVLGKLLFFEEQLSSDDTVACATCHVFSAGGTDPRAARNPGPNGSFFDLDDRLGSLGVLRSDAQKDYEPDAVFGFDRQVTARDSMSVPMAAYVIDAFWDGRASHTYTDPQTGQVVIPNGGALESQVSGPPVSDVEMAHETRDWSEVAAKLAKVKPMALASDLPPDMAAAVAGNPSYPNLFAAAFGDGAITARRIAFAIATYERTLVPNQTPWDAFNAGQPNAMTPQQVQGWNVFNSPGAHCNVCHTPPVFSNQSFRNIGLRPTQEDTGRQIVTGNPADRGRFKVPSLRDVGLRNSFMHNGGIVAGGMATVRDVIDFYIPANGHQQFPDNIDPAVPTINMPPQAANDLAAFLTGGLTDPRVANETFPFDRPTLHSERVPANPSLQGGGVAGLGGLVPEMIAMVPPHLGSTDFKLGLANARGGALAYVVVSTSPPNGGGVSVRFGPFQLDGTGAGAGFTTLHRPLPDDAAFAGTDLYFQWNVLDPAAPGGVAKSEVARATLF